MSGMELLLQAASCSDGASRSVGVTRDGDRKRGAIVSPPVSKVASSLPPKKRMRLGVDGYTVVTTSTNESAFHLRRSGSGTISLGSGGSDSEWTEASAAESRRRPASISPLFSSVVVPNRSVGEKRSGNDGISSKKSPKRPKASRAAKQRAASSLVRDMDGNDVGMGYFSMSSRGSPPAAEDLPRPSRVPANTAVVGVANPQDASKEGRPHGAAIEKTVARVLESKPSRVKPESRHAAAKALLYQAYLQALNQNLQLQQR